MKHILLTITLAASSLLPACSTTSSEQKAQLTSLANTALVYAELTGQINPKQAAAIRSVGTLVLTATESKELDLQAISSVVVEHAVSNGQLTQAQADALLAAGTVPLVPEPTPVAEGPSNPLLPAPAAP